jgi:hypothetical protein
MLNQLTNEAWKQYKKISKIKFVDTFQMTLLDKQQRLENRAYARYNRRMYAWKYTTNALDRPYSQFNMKNGLVEWYFNGRVAEGVYGPFPSKEKAIKALAEFIQFNIEFSDDGGRSLMNDAIPPKIYRPYSFYISTGLST